MSSWLRPQCGQYVTADLAQVGADLVLDIENIALPDASVDVVLVSHVLEHVNDRAALAEIGRILRPGGRALIMVPIVEGWATTYESSTVRTAKDREEHYGQHDHLRYYGSDVRKRILDAGYSLREWTAPPEVIPRYALQRGEPIFIASPDLAAPAASDQRVVPETRTGVHRVAPRFSVVIPAHDARRDVGRAISSVQQQTFSDHEIIVVCDSCSDGTEDEVRRFGVEPVVIHGGGAGPARNAGLERARGDYVLFLDSDDYYLRSDAFELLDQALTRDPVDILHFDFMWAQQRYAAIDANGEMVPMVWCKAFLRSAIEHMRFVNITPGQDGEFTKRIGANHNLRHGALRECLLQYVYPNEGSTMARYGKPIKMLERHRVAGDLLVHSGDQRAASEVSTWLPYRIVVVLNSFDSVVSSWLLCAYRRGLDPSQPLELVLAVPELPVPTELQQLGCVCGVCAAPEAGSVHVAVEDYAEVSVKPFEVVIDAVALDRSSVREGVTLVSSATRDLSSVVRSSGVPLPGDFMAVTGPSPRHYLAPFLVAVSKRQVERSSPATAAFAEA